jgi:type II protein arginine methyltransferase
MKAMQSDPYENAFALYRAGQIEAAVSAYRALLVLDPGNPEANHMIGVIAFQQGRNDIARDFIARATTAATGVTPEMYNNLGSVLIALTQNEDAIAAFEKAIAMRPDYPDALNNLGVVYRNTKRIEKAIECLKRAVALNPNLTHAQANLRAAYRDVVPSWHFAMMDDKQRNDAYEAAIRKAVPGKKVLDIGTGAGLLSLMSARAGAAQVTGCEAVGVIAERAQTIVQKNGFASRVTIHGKPSQEMEVGRELPERAEVLVTETFSSGLINEYVLPTIEHAHEHLLTPDATVIPAAGSAVGYLVGGDVLKGLLFVGRVNGFDISPFDDFAPPNLQMSLDRFPHDILSDDTELMRFSLKDRSFPMDGRRISVPVTKAGVCLGVAQWIRLELDDTIRYENRPGADAPFNGHWSHVVYRFARPLPVQPGDSVPLLIRHYRTQITVELAD